MNPDLSAQLKVVKFIIFQVICVPISEACKDLEHTEALQKKFDKFNHLAVKLNKDQHPDSATVTKKRDVSSYLDFNLQFV